MNCVRKHLSAIKGGRLAALCAPARVVTLLISDVPGDEPEVIASGPTVPDATTCAEALAICARYGIELPPAARAGLRQRRVRDAQAGRPALRRPRGAHDRDAAAEPRSRGRAGRAPRASRRTSSATRSKAKPARSARCTPRWRVPVARRGAPFAQAVRDPVRRRDHGHRARQGRPRRPRHRVPARLRASRCRASPACTCWRPTPTASTASRTTPAPSSRPAPCARRGAGPEAGRAARPQRRLQLLQAAGRPGRHRADLHQRQRLPRAADHLRRVAWTGRQVRK